MVTRELISSEPLASCWHSVVYEHKLIISYYEKWRSLHLSLKRWGGFDDTFSLCFHLFKHVSVQALEGIQLCCSRLLLLLYRSGQMNHRRVFSYVFTFSTVHTHTHYTNHKHGLMVVCNDKTVVAKHWSNNNNRGWLHISQSELWEKNADKINTQMSELFSDALLM